MGAVREQVLAHAESLEPFYLELVIQHEQQHNETMLQLLRQLDGYKPHRALAEEYLAPPVGEQHIRLREAASRAYRPMSRRSDMIAFPAGSYLVGTAPKTRALIYDNELLAHEQTLDAFEIATRPVTNGDFAEWIEFGGYKKPEWWTAEGWDWLAEQGEEFDPAPLGWKRSDGGWISTDFGAHDPIDLSAPVCHVNWHEASAYARAHGSRLPTEFEWEVAASYDPRVGASGGRRTYAWGDNAWVPGAANLDQLAFGAHPVGSADHGFAPIDMLGQVWEWTSSEFSAYPGFTPFAYEQYSAPFFDAGYRVLRGGSWATRARTVTNTFRNWDLPARRQIFSGFRLARTSN
jgi:iron(II)-dependent oxidoreductase